MPRQIGGNFKSENEITEVVIMKIERASRAVVFQAFRRTSNFVFKHFTQSSKITRAVPRNSFHE